MDWWICGNLLSALKMQVASVLVLFAPPLVPVELPRFTLTAQTAAGKERFGWDVFVLVLIASSPV